MTKDRVKEYAKKLSDEGKLAEPEKRGLLSRLFGAKKCEDNPPLPTDVDEPKSDINTAMEMIEKLANDMAELKKKGSSKVIDESFVKALKGVDRKKVEAKAAILEQGVIIPNGRVQEFLDQMGKYGVDVGSIEIPQK